MQIKLFVELEMPHCFYKHLGSLIIQKSRKSWYHKLKMTSYLWRKYADYLHTKWEKTLLWDMIEPYRRPKSFTPLVTIYICAFYTGVVGAAITEQLYKEKYWEDHPGEFVPLMKPKFYGGPWRVIRGEVPVFIKE